MNFKNNPPFDKAIIHYFSGTGNAKSVAYWIGEKIYNEGIGVQIKNIGTQPKITTDDKENFKKEISESSLLGFCYPTHGFNAPPIVLKYLWNFPKAKEKTKVFVINTRAGMKLSKIFLPGISGIALLLPALILLLKGYKLIGYRSIDLPSNWISLHPGLREKIVNSIFIRCKKITRKFSDSILSSKKVLVGFWWLPIDIALLPISIGYYFYGRFMLSKTFIATHACNNCGLCVESCPVNAISIKDNKPYWSYNCESCMHCMNHCPTRAIETPHGFTALIWWLSFSILPFIALSLLSDFTDFKGITFEIIYKTISLILSITVIFGGYRIVHKLMNFRVINFIIRYTSFTSYKFWRRYKAPTRFN